MRPSNEDGDESSATTIVRPQTMSHRPRIYRGQFGADQRNGARSGGQTVTLDASRSSDPNGELVDYEWCVGNDGSFDETGKTIEVTVSAPGEHPVVLRVVDDGGSTATDRITLATNC